MASTNNRRIEASTSLPSELHLATCAENTPHISLMNYTYLPTSPYTRTPSIVMTTPPNSRKTSNLLTNPRVSLLVHDWVSHRPPTLSSPLAQPPPAEGAAPRESAPSPPPRGRSGLAELLANLNTASLSRISATINGTAALVPVGSDEEAWLKARHLENNTFGPSALDLAGFSSSPNARRGWGGAGGGGGLLDDEAGGEDGDGGKRCFIEGEEVRVVIVKIVDGRVADWRGDVRDWAIEGLEDALEDVDTPPVNGVV